MNKRLVFLDIDTQHDFMDADGALAVAGAAAIRQNLQRLTRAAGEHGIPIIASEDAHDAADPEFEQFPPHCVRGSAGARKIAETSVAGQFRIPASGRLPGEVRRALNGGRPLPQVVLEKKTLSVFSNPAAKRVLEAMLDAEVVVYGVATEYCVKEAVEGLLERSRGVIIVTDAVCGVSESAQAQTLEELSARGARLMTTDETIALLGA